MDMWIYKIKNTTNGKVYIGKTVNKDRRIKDHVWSLNLGRHCNSHLQNAWNKYGEESFVFEIIEKVGGLIVDHAEKWWINYYKSNFPANGYNKTLGGDGCYGRIMTEETKRKISDSNKGKTVSAEARKKIGMASKNRYYSPEIRKKMSEAQKGRTVSKETRAKMSRAWSGKKGKLNNRAKPVVCLNTGEIFESTTEAAQKLGLTQNLVSWVANGKRSHTKNYKFEYF